MGACSEMPAAIEHGIAGLECGYYNRRAYPERLKMTGW